MSSLYQLHIEKWQDCMRCHLANCRMMHNGYVALGRGEIPADICFIGEAPAETEDMCGAPFSGQAGNLLDNIIADSVPPEISYAISNLVGCIPRDEDGGKVHKPDDEAIEACKPRIVEFVKICDPKLIIAVGGVARDWIEPGYKYSIQFHKPLSTEERPSADPRAIQSISIVHPSHILSRMPTAQKGNAVKRCKVVIRQAIERVFNGRGTVSSQLV